MHNTLEVRKMLFQSRSFVAALLAVAFACNTAPAEPTAAEPEFRAAWVATVANIDWPSRKDLSTADQKAELIAILDRAVELNLNAIVFQVRPMCDALYASELEPWSEYLTGTQGKAPDPFYDPLEFIVAEAHQRGLQLHAWFNPYRAGHTTSESSAASTHISQNRPELVREYGKQRWLDPGEPEAADHTLAVVLDIVRRYDVDGVHMDDYFYPYPIKDDDGNRVDFPDNASWYRAQSTGNQLSRDDWRRNNVDTLIERLYREVHELKPHVMVGISPFGIWRPGHPKEVTGFDQYAELYADARKWLREGWVDYFTPQLYWKIDSEGQSFPKLLAWWQKENVKDRHLWPGLFTSRIGNTGRGNWEASEILAQIQTVRDQPGATGHVHFSMKALLNNSGGVAEQLLEGPYAEPAPVPQSPWLQPQ